MSVPASARSGPAPARTPGPAPHAPPIQREPAPGPDPFDYRDMYRRSDENVGEVAAAGVTGGGAPLPHIQRIQEAFGRHDVRGVRAHVGGEAAAAAAAIGAAAYATGNNVAFREPPDLHTAAHEAAHVVQQRGGVDVPGGVGRAGDRYEQHADAVADRVVRGESAEGLLDEVGGAGGGAVQKQHDPDGERPRGKALQAAISDFHEGFLDIVGTLIEVGAGAVGTEVEILVTVRIPVYEALFVSGQLQLKVSHDAEGYMVKGRPGLGVSVGTVGSNGGAFADLFANYTVQAQAGSGRRVLEMISLALEAECRAMRDEPPPILMGAFLSAVSHGLIPALDTLDRLWNWAQGEGYTSSFWPWLADAVWGEGHMTTVMEGMAEGELAQTIDGGSLSGSASSGGGNDETEASAAGRFGLGQRRRIERRKGQSRATETEDTLFEMKLNFGLGPAGCEIEVLAPLTPNSRGGTFKVEVSLTLLDMGMWNVAFDALTESIRIAVREILRYMRREDQGDNQKLRDAVAQIEAGTRAARDDFYGLGQDALYNRLATAGVAERAVQLAAEVDFDTLEWKFVLAAVDEIEPLAGHKEMAGQSAAITRERNIVEVTTGS